MSMPTILVCPFVVAMPSTLKLPVVAKAVGGHNIWTKSSETRAAAAYFNDEVDVRDSLVHHCPLQGPSHWSIEAKQYCEVGWHTEHPVQLQQVSRSLGEGVGLPVGAVGGLVGRGVGFETGEPGPRGHHVPPQFPSQFPWDAKQYAPVGSHLLHRDQLQHPGPPPVDVGEFVGSGVGDDVGATEIGVLGPTEGFAVVGPETGNGVGGNGVGEVTGIGVGEGWVGTPVHHIPAQLFSHWSWDARQNSVVCSHVVHWDQLQHVPSPPWG
mmetsp:Transcript_8788/g.17222  ORF Transcript_8788/g.17222 Transcript_8788/m.17222 type:complete len:267 (-) Transcript_8788:1003-1803(-)